MGLLFRWMKLVWGMRWWRQFRKKRSLFRGSLMLLTVFGLHSYLLYHFEQGHHKPAFTWFDSLWLTLTTFTTVGYGDIYAKTVEGRWTTIVFGYVAGLSLFAWLASTLASRLLERTDLRRRGMVPLKLKNHTLLINIPSPQKVRLLIERLREVEKPLIAPLVVITNEYEALPFPDDDEIHFVRGSVTDPDTYKRAGIAKAKRAIVLAQDNENPHSDALTAAAISVIESLNPDVHTIAECLFESHFMLFQHVQCDQIVYTGDILVKLLVQEAEDEGAARAVTRLLDPEGNEFYSTPIGSSTEGRTFQELVAPGPARSQRALLACRFPARWRSRTQSTPRHCPLAQGRIDLPQPPSPQLEVHGDPFVRESLFFLGKSPNILRNQDKPLAQKA